MITSFSSFPVYALQGFGATPFSVPLLSRWWSRGKEEGEGEKRKGQEKGKGKAPRRRSPAGGAARPVQRCSRCLCPRRSPPSFVQLRAGLRTVLGFPLAVPEPCRRMPCPLQEAVAAWQEWWLCSEPAKLTFPEVPDPWRGDLSLGDQLWLYSKNSIAEFPPLGSQGVSSRRTLLSNKNKHPCCILVQ